MFNAFWDVKDGGLKKSETLMGKNRSRGKWVCWNVIKKRVATCLKRKIAILFRSNILRMGYSVIREVSQGGLQ